MRESDGSRASRARRWPALLGRGAVYVVASACPAYLAACRVPADLGWSCSFGARRLPRSTPLLHPAVDFLAGLGVVIAKRPPHR
jgi:hypothetical protein